MPRLPYLSWHADAERRYRRGERQGYCLTCRLWRWPDECEQHVKLTAKEFRVFIAQTRKEVRRRYPTESDRYRRELAAAMRKGEAQA